VPGIKLRAQVPSGKAQVFYVELVDEADNVVARVGSPAEPLELPAPAVEEKPKPVPPPPTPAPPAAVKLTAPPPPAPPPRMLYAGIGIGALSIGFLAAGIGLDRAAVMEFDSLQKRCAPMCPDEQLATYRLERDLSYAAFGVAGAAAVTAIVLIAVDRGRAAHGSR
jgi:hypothetical protein